MRTWWRRLLDWFRQLGQEPGPAGLRLAADELAARRRTLAAAALRAEVAPRRPPAPSFVVTPAAERAVVALRPAVPLGPPLRAAVPLGPPPRPRKVLDAAPLPPPSLTQELTDPVVWTFPAAWAIPAAELPIEFQAPEPPVRSPGAPPAATVSAELSEVEEEEVPIEFLPPDPEPFPVVAASAAQATPADSGPAARGATLRTPTKRGGLGMEYRAPARRLRPGLSR